MDYWYTIDVEFLRAIQPAEPLSILAQHLAVAAAQLPIFFIPIHLLLLWFYGRPFGKKDALTAFILLMISLGVAFGIGHTLYRARPYLVGASHALMSHRPSASFPSDHALIFGVYLYCLWYERYRCAFYLCLLCALVTCYARVYVGIHYPSDVLGGLGIGVLCAALFIRPVSDFVGRLKLVARS